MEHLHTIWGTYPEIGFHKVFEFSRCTYSDFKETYDFHLEDPLYLVPLSPVATLSETQYIFMQRHSGGIFALLQFLTGKTVIIQELYYIVNKIINHFDDVLVNTNIEIGVFHQKVYCIHSVFSYIFSLNNKQFNV